MDNFEKLKRDAMKAADSAEQQRKKPSESDAPKIESMAPRTEQKKCRSCAMLIPKAAKICPYCRKKQGWTLPAKIFAGIFILMAFSAAINAGKTSTSTSTNPAPLTPKEQALSTVKLDFEWGTGGFGNIMEANFTIKNPSNYDIKDITIKCRHFAKSGTLIDSNTRTIYDIVQAKSNKRFERFNMGFIHSQAEKSNCAIADLQIK